jgi:hypothetical protein
MKTSPFVLKFNVNFYVSPSQLSITGVHMGSRVHRVNSLNETFASDMSKALRNVTVNLRNTIFMR